MAREFAIGDRVVWKNPRGYIEGSTASTPPFAVTQAEFVPAAVCNCEAPEDYRLHMPGCAIFYWRQLRKEVGHRQWVDVSDAHGKSLGTFSGAYFVKTSIPNESLTDG